MKEKILEKILDPMPLKVITLGVGVAIAVGSYFGLKAYDNHIQKNLEPYAINCKMKNNIIGMPDWEMNLPKIKNKDLDGNGKYESIIVYMKEGKKFYQGIRKTDEGLMLTEPKLYE